MGMHEVLFPTNISFGSRGGPGFNTAILQSDSGAETRVSRWANARHGYDAAYGVKSAADLFTVKAFYLARKGAANSFLFKDFADCTSNPTDPSHLASAGTKDQSIGTGDGATTIFQLTKKYTSGSITHTRIIQKPATGTVRVWLDNTEQLSGWSVDTTTGKITFTSAPANGAIISASFQFYVPVRFGEEADKLLTATQDSYAEGSIDTIPLLEDMNPDPGNVGEIFYGGSVETSISANMSLSTGLGRFWVITATTTGLIATLPDPASIPTGGPIFYISLEGSNNLIIKDHLGATLLTLTPGQNIEILLTLQNGGTKVWYAV